MDNICIRLSFILGKIETSKKDQMIIGIVLTELFLSCSSRKTLLKDLCLVHVVLNFFCFDLPYLRHYNPLLIRNRSWILSIHKAKGHST